MSHTIEQWLPVVGYEGIYEVSDQGRVRGLDRTDAAGRKWRGKILTPEATKGYLRVRLTKDGVGANVFIHTLVLETFVSPRPSGCDSCHNDGNAMNNALSNLRWDSRSSNMRDKVLHGTDHDSRKTHCPRGHLLVEPNLMPSNLKRGTRACLACSRARNHARYHKLETYDSVADMKYADIMSSLNT